MKTQFLSRLVLDKETSFCKLQRSRCAIVNTSHGNTIPLAEIVDYRRPGDSCDVEMTRLDMWVDKILARIMFLLLMDCWGGP